MKCSSIGHLHRCFRAVKMEFVQIMTVDERKPNPSLPAAKRGRRRVLLLSIPLVPIVVFAVFAFYKCYWQVERLKAEIRAKGEPVTYEELLALYPEVPDEQNAALKVIEAIELFVRPEDIFGNACIVPEYCFKYEQPGPMDRWTAGELEETEKFLSLNSAFFSKITEASKLSTAHFPVSYDAKYACVYNPHAYPMLAIDKALLTQITWKAEIGDVVGIGDSIIEIFKIADTLKLEPSLESQSFRQIFYSEGWRAIVRVLNRVKLSDEQLKRIAQPLDGLHGWESDLRGIMGDRACLLDLQQDDVENTRDYPLLRLSSHYDRGDTIQFYTDLIEVLRLAPDIRRQRAIELAEGVLEGEKDTLARRTHLHDFFQRYAIGPADGISSSMNLQSRLACARASIAIERFKLAHGGALPDKLDELVPTFLERVPEDEFNGKSLRFKKLDNRYIVYSVGENLVDDGGVERKSDKEVGDVVVAVDREKWEKSVRPAGPRKLWKVPDEAEPN
jgi:hypothetical protein